MRIRKSILLLVCLSCFAAGFALAHIIGHSATATTTTPTASVRNSLEHESENSEKNAACRAVVKHAVSIATQNLYSTTTDCVGTIMNDAVILDGHKPGQEIAPLVAGLIIPASQWQPESISAFIIPHLAHSAALIQDASKDATLNPASMLCKPRNIKLKIDFADNAPSMNKSEFADHIRKSAPQILAAFSAPYTIQQDAVSSIANAIQNLTDEYTDFFNIFGDFILGATFDSSNQQLNAYVLTQNNLAACQQVMKHDLIRKMMLGYGLILKQRPKKMTLACNTAIEQEFTLQSTQQYGDACVTPILALYSFGTKPLKYNISEASK